MSAEHVEDDDLENVIPMECASCGKEFLWHIVDPLTDQCPACRADDPEPGEE
jgi:predicted Zn-ribbon and HTH transcriptional regulator